MYFEAHGHVLFSFLLLHQPTFSVYLLGPMKANHHLEQHTVSNNCQSFFHKQPKNNQTKPQAGSLAEAEKNVQFWNDYIIAAKRNIEIGIKGLDTDRRRTVQVGLGLGLGRSLDEELKKIVKKKVESAINAKEVGRRA
ncbi:uncharacterized protein B0J16DRAFT_321903 [Fusarium flagelliforme]|uniref:uncharacterized protein n=1 Tax=Fusarium flagelliforme TaxID=2675880 RepID=UPI001E8E010F|nr:uncharacterized protein B0J16DRAFT_321903 [Fusarium flagelliforme]KAH7183161.1 hypothetical protein B0J16DRAFT_321903 [Fusarium flagelliforme]